ncbi:MAG: 50S ribosomal protein L11 methyltransferase [Candidatus Chloroheliales bacterium]|nr:MAG: 50S ribosomal protein L11 methyltransferase [Chloroflexota bacterium]
MKWIELSVEADREAAEAISELFAKYGYNGGVAIEEPIIPDEDEEDKYEVDLSRPVTVSTWLPDDELAAETRERIVQNLWHLGQMRYISPLRVTVSDEEDWANAWKEHYHVLRVGRHVVIRPSWREYSPEPGDVSIELDPGMAFGTGLHPTTRLCLAALEDYVAPAMSVLDLGSGSGILAIAAAKLGAATVLAIDNDPVAVKSAAENVALNPEVGGRIGVVEGTLEATGGAQFNLVVANIIAKVIIELASGLAGALLPGATLIVSGIIEEKADSVALALAAAGLHNLERRQEGDWVALVARRARD